VHYLADDCASASRELRAAIDADVKAGATPQLERLQMLSNCFARLGDSAGFAYALEKLLVYHPSREYWTEAIRRAEAGPGFAERLLLDALRLRQATGTLRGSADYAAMAQLALTGGLPAEAKRISELGLASGAPATDADGSGCGDCATRQPSRWPRTRSSSRRAPRPPRRRPTGRHWSTSALPT
jgi:hypothetical protein